MEYALRLAKIESVKARERQATSTGGSNPQLSLKLDKAARTDEIVAAKLGIGGKDTYRKEKFIYENQSSLTPEDFADWDEGRLSTNKAYQQIKTKLQQQEEQLKSKQQSVDLLKQKYVELQEQEKTSQNPKEWNTL